jgi:hypothetical protein
VSAELPGGVEVGGSLRQTQGAGPQDPLPAVLGQWQALRAKNEGGQKETRRGGARRAVRGRSQARRGCPQKRRQLGTRGAEKTHPDMPLVRKNVVPGGPLLVVGRWAGDRRRRGGGRRGGGGGGGGGRGPPPAPGRAGGAGRGRRAGGGGPPPPPPGLGPPRAPGLSGCGCGLRCGLLLLLPAAASSQQSQPPAGSRYHVTA